MEYSIMTLLEVCVMKIEMSEKNNIGQLKFEVHDDLDGNVEFVIHGKISKEYVDELTKALQNLTGTTNYTSDDLLEEIVHESMNSFWWINEALKSHDFTLEEVTSMSGWEPSFGKTGLN